MPAGSSLDHLHGLCEWIGGVRYLVNARFDANSLKDNNPLYRMVGRREPSGSAIIAALARKGVKQRPRASGRLCHTLRTSSACLAGCASQIQRRRVLQGQRSFNFSAWRRGGAALSG